MLLNKKIILITGSSRGIGKTTVEKCLEEGACVVANYRTRTDEIEKLEKNYSKEQLLTFQADITDGDEVGKMIDYVKHEYGCLSGIVNNAGIITRTSDWRKISCDDWFQNINTNVIGAWNVISQGVDILSNGGSIVNVSSIYGMFPEADEITYSISKAGVNALTYALAKKLAPNIRVNAIMPGNTLTSMVPKQEKLDEIEAKTLLKRSATPTEIADAIVFLLSDMSGYMTGCSIPVDGGYQVI